MGGGRAGGPGGVGMMSMGGMASRSGDNRGLNKPQNQPSQFGMAPK